MLKVRQVMRSVKNNVLDYDDVQLRMREATSNDPTGPDERLLARLAHDTRDRYSYNSLFTILWKRLTDLQHPSHVLKSLIVTEYLLKHADPRFARDIRARKRVIKQLTGYRYYKTHADVGGEVREHAKRVLALIADENDNMASPQQRSQMSVPRQGQPDTFFNRMGNDNHSPSGSRDPFASSPSVSHQTSAAKTKERRKNSKTKAKEENYEEVAEKKKKKKKKTKKKKEVEEEDDEEVEQVTTGFAKFEIAQNEEVDLLTGGAVGGAANYSMAVASSNWMNDLRMGDELFQNDNSGFAQLEAPALLDDIREFSDSGQGSVQHDGFALDASIEIESDEEVAADDRKNDVWNVGAHLTDVDNIREGYYYGYNARPKAKPKPTEPAKNGPQKTMKELMLEKVEQQRAEDSDTFRIRPLDQQLLYHQQHQRSMSLNQGQALAIAYPGYGPAAVGSMAPMSSAPDPNAYALALVPAQPVGPPMGAMGMGYGMDMSYGMGMNAGGMGIGMGGYPPAMQGGYYGQPSVPLGMDMSQASIGRAPNMPSPRRTTMPARPRDSFKR